MIRNRLQIILIVLIMLIESCIWPTKSPSKEYEQTPLETFYVVFDYESLDEFFGVFEQFTSDHNFTYELTDYGGKEELFLVYMTRDDLEILATKTSVPTDSATEFVVTFYPRKFHGPEPNLEVMTELSNELQSLLMSIPGLRISDTQTY